MLVFFLKLCPLNLTDFLVYPRLDYKHIIIHKKTVDPIVSQLFFIYTEDNGVAKAS